MDKIAFKQVAIASIDANPHRDFELSPIDETRVARLVASYKVNGDFGSLSVRRHPEKEGRYQLAGGGHHRLEAAKKRGLRNIDVKIVDYNDDAMLKEQLPLLVARIDAAANSLKTAAELVADAIPSPPAAAGADARKAKPATAEAARPVPATPTAEEKPTIPASTPVREAPKRH